MLVVLEDGHRTTAVHEVEGGMASLFGTVPRTPLGEKLPRTVPGTVAHVGVVSSYFLSPCFHSLNRTWQH